MEKARKNMIGIYVLRNHITDISFLGSAPSMLNHLEKHFNKLSSGNHENLRMQKIWDEYGPSSFEFLCLESVSNKYLLMAKEKYWMEKINAIPIGGDHQYAHMYASTVVVRISKKLHEELRKLNMKTYNDAICFLIDFYKQHSEI